MMIIIIIKFKTLNLWHKTTKGNIAVYNTSENDWQMAVRGDNAISIKLRQFYKCRLSLSDPLVLD